MARFAAGDNDSRNGQCGDGRVTGHAGLADQVGPFVLLDDARAKGAAPARLFTRPIAIVSAVDADDVAPLLATVRAWLAEGAYVAGYLSYDAGFALEPSLTAAAGARAASGDSPLAWFGKFTACERIAANAVPGRLPDPAGALLGAPVPRISRAAYHDAVAAVLDHISAGDIYQANLTFVADVAVHGHPLAAYSRLRQAAQAGYGGIVFTGDHWLLSHSPELFVALKDRAIIARPMKGTATRGHDPVSDAAIIAALAADPKQRAENLMIVDLIRNDLSRIAAPGSVAVPDLFRVETYPTIHQMVSDVTATLADGCDIVDIISQVFPCGSITGAPKIRSMASLDTLEHTRRGPYTGSIGFAAPGTQGTPGDAAFNVAIRTLVVRNGDTAATIGLGSGIVADSVASAEWHECLAKGAYVRGAGAKFDLFETMAFDPANGFVRLDRHLERMNGSARLFGFSFDRHAVRNMLQHATFHQTEPARVRLRLSRAGNIAVEVDPMPTPPSADAPVGVALAAMTLHPSDIRLAHKTSDRAFYDDPRRASGVFEVVFTNAVGRITEGSFTSVFVERGGQLLTPKRRPGLLPGVLTGELIDEGRAIEADLSPADLANGFLIGNSLRGLIRARLI